MLLSRVNSRCLQNENAGLSDEKRFNATSSSYTMAHIHSFVKDLLNRIGNGRDLNVAELRNQFAIAHRGCNRIGLCPGEADGQSC